MTSPGEPAERRVLDRLVRDVVRAFDLDPDGEIVAAGPATPRRFARVPRTPCAGDELHERPVPANEVVRRDAQGGDGGECGMRGRVEPVREETLDRIAAELTGRQ